MTLKIARLTRQGTVVEGALRRASGFRSAQELHADLVRSDEKVGLSTVYRHVTALVSAGTVDAVQTAEGEMVYRLCGTDAHHHHVVCRSCGASTEVEAVEVEVWAAAVARDAGFTDVTHTVEVFGTCASCASESP